MRYQFSESNHYRIIDTFLDSKKILSSSVFVGKPDRAPQQLHRFCKHRLTDSTFPSPEMP